MPAKSKAQQRFFAMVHGYQTGKLSGDKVSARVKKVAKTISPEEAHKYMHMKDEKLSEVFYKIFNSPVYVEETLREIVESKSHSGYVKGMLIDSFTAKMLVTVMDKLNKTNKNMLLSYPLNEMVAVSYKVLTY